MVKIQMKIGITFIKYKIYGKDSDENWNQFYKV